MPTKLEASTSGEARAKVGAGLLFEVFPNVDAHTAWGASVIPSLEVATSDGVAHLLGLSDKDGVSSNVVGRAGLSLGLAKLDLSEEGRGTPYVPIALYLGGDLSRGTYSYRTPNAAGTGALDAIEDKPLVGGGFGTTGYKLWPQADRWSPTIEWLASYRSDYKASSNKIRWCSSAGNVDGSEAQSCNEGILGAPKNTQKVVLGAHVGLLHTRMSSHPWRVALGSQFAIPTATDDELRFRAEARIPFYFTLGHMGSDKAWATYAGIIRLMPQVAIDEPKAGDTSITATLQLQFLGQRTLFADAFDSTL